MGRIGIDESGKGDYFGYLVVAGAYSDEKTDAKLKEMRIRDSKTVSDPACLRLATGIKKICVHDVLKISPEKYNKLYGKFGNLNRLLAWGHAKVIDNMTKKVKCTKVLSDKFSEENLIEGYLDQMKKKNPAMEKVRLERKVRAESDMAVAAASILARAEYLRTLRALSMEIGYSLPKGATHVRQAKEDVAKMHGEDALQHVAKLHFNV
ncbi:MAG: ribonuclease HIII [Candidatus Aenigmarchaeota archaeon]|nr:ribonuclease HIII [Candidatus Aenigmarchaeota archaeon]